MSDILGRLAGLGALTPEIMMQLLGMMIDAVGTGEEWTGENLDALGELTQRLADKVRGIKGDAAG
jgi:hypothetical protein